MDAQKEEEAKTTLIEEKNEVEKSIENSTEEENQKVVKDDLAPASKEKNKHKHHKKHKTKSKKIENEEYSIVEVISSPKKGNEITLEKIEKIRFKPLKRFFNIRQKKQAVDYNEKRIENSKDKCRLRIMMDAVVSDNTLTCSSVFNLADSSILN